MYYKAVYSKLNLAYQIVGIPEKWDPGAEISAGGTPGPIKWD